MSEFIDYYGILDITQSCSQKDVKDAFHRLSKQHHPDHGGNRVYYQQITEAYETLKNQEKRAEYDSLYYLNKNNENKDVNIFSLRKDYKNFMEANHKELSKDEIDNIYKTQFIPKKLDNIFTQTDINARINDITLEKKNLDDEFDNNNLETFIKENKDVDVNELMEFICHQKPKTREIIPFDGLGGAESISGNYFNGASMFDETNASVSSSLYSGIDGFDTYALQAPENKIDFNEFKEWKNKKIVPDKMKDGEIKSYRDRRREEDEEIKRIIEENTKTRIKETQLFLGMKTVEDYPTPVMTTTSSAQTQQVMHGSYF